MWKYVRSSYRNDPFRILLELGLVVFFCAYVLHKKYRPGTVSGAARLTRKQEEELIQEWEPEPLAKPTKPTFPDEPVTTLE